jgi:hypothetical protein
VRRSSARCISRSFAPRGAELRMRGAEPRQMPVRKSACKWMMAYTPNSKALMSPRSRCSEIPGRIGT